MKRKRKSNNDERIESKNRTEQKVVEQRETMEALTFQDDEIQNASRLAFSPEKIDTSTAEAKAKALETIKAEINGLHTEIDQNKSVARKLMSNAVQYAEHIGDRLLFVRWHLLKRGEYQDWVGDNFDGGLSTAPAYTRIANLKNWTKISSKLHSGALTLEQALALIKKRGPEKRRTEGDGTGRIPARRETA
jgi:hypothetical protein